MKPPSLPAQGWSLVSEKFWQRVAKASAAWKAGSDGLTPALWRASRAIWVLERSGRAALP